MKQDTSPVIRDLLPRGDSAASAPPTCPAPAAGRESAAGEDATARPPRDDYHITPDKLLSPREVAHLLRTSQRLAQRDLDQGRTAWVKRYLLVHLACASGLRAGEIAGLRVADFQEPAAGPQLVVRHSQVGRSRRVQVGLGLACHLREFLEFRRRNWGEICAGPDLILPGRRGRPYSTAALGASFRKAVEAARLPAVYSLRNTRHTYAAFLLAQTGDLRFVQRQVGHANQSMTVLYREVTPLADADLARALLS
ncbi:MAG: site-specific integrase [Deltaproteobacteria bacterium]|nr:site-specific integrase [Deltaproteobacteria bacterium]